MESVTGMKWNQWPRSNGIRDRNGMESVAGIAWNMQALQPVILRDQMRQHYEHSGAIGVDDRFV